MQQQFKSHGCPPTLTIDKDRIITKQSKVWGKSEGAAELHKSDGKIS